MIALTHVSFSYDSQPFLQDFSLQLSEKKVTTIVGVNGSGKSTVLSLLTRQNRPQTGQLLLDQQDAWQMNLRQFAQEVALLHQKNQVYDQIKVRDLLRLGKLPYTNLLTPGKLAVDSDLLDLFQLDELQDSYLQELSGGQQQRVWLALALNQNPRYLFLDEPTTFLDLHYQQLLLKTLRALVQKKGISICLVLHDLNQALRYSDQVILLKRGKIISQGPAPAVLTPEHLRQGFAINCQLLQTEHGPYLVQY